MEGLPALPLPLRFKAYPNTPAICFHFFCFFDIAIPTQLPPFWWGPRKRFRKLRHAERAGPAPHAPHIRTNGRIFICQATNGRLACHLFVPWNNLTLSLLSESPPTTARLSSRTFPPLERLFWCQFKFTSIWFKLNIIFNLNKKNQPYNFIMEFPSYRSRRVPCCGFFCFVELFRPPTFLLGSLTPRPSLHTQQCPAQPSTTAAVSMKVIKRNFPLLTPHGIRRKKMNIWQWWLLVKRQSLCRNITRCSLQQFSVYFLDLAKELKHSHIQAFQHSHIHTVTQSRILDVGEFFPKTVHSVPVNSGSWGGEFSPGFSLPPNGS